MWQHTDGPITQPFSIVQPGFQSGAPLSSTAWGFVKSDPECQWTAMIACVSDSDMVWQRFWAHSSWHYYNFRWDLATLARFQSITHADSFFCLFIQSLSAEVSGPCTADIYRHVNIVIHRSLLYFFVMYFGRFVMNWSCLISSQSHCILCKQLHAKDNQCPKIGFYWKTLLDCHIIFFI